MPPRLCTKRSRTSGTSVYSTPLTPATPAPVEPDVRSALDPVEPTLPRNEHSEDLCEYDSDGLRIRKERSAATPALVESLRYVSRDSYPTEDLISHCHHSPTG
jgi:hypothetical protein